MTGRPGWLKVVVVVVAVAGSAVARAQTPAERGVTWLLAHQDPDGGFGTTTGENRVLATSEAVLALRAEGMGASTQVQQAELFLSLQHPADTDLAARRLWALRGTELEDDAGMKALATRVLASGPTGPDTGMLPGWTPTPDILALALLALVPPDGAPVPRPWLPAGSFGGAPEAFQDPGLVLLNMSRTDGFGLVDSASDPSTTGLAVEALRPFRRIPWFPGRIDMAIVAGILDQQQLSGEIGDGAQPVIDTAHGLLALEDLAATRFSQNLISAGARADGFLQGAQQNDGSWGDGVYATALVLRAFTSRLPDYKATTDELGQTYMALLPPVPLAGQQVAARVQVQDASTAAAPPTTVRLVATPEAGGSPVTLAEVPVPGLTGGQTQDVQIPFSTTGLSGRYRLVATFDPDNLVPEILETNNVTTGEINVVNAVDLAISSSDIHFQDAGGGSVTVTATVHAYGSAVTTPFEVAFYEGSPVSGGTSLGQVPVSGIAAAGTSTVSVTWDASHVGGPTSVYVIVDPAKAVKEATRDDNEAFRMYFPGAAAQVNLAVYNTDIVQTPRPSYPGQTVDVDVPVHNLGQNDAQRVMVALENLGGGPLGEVELDRVPAGGVVDAHFAVPLENRTTVKAIVDPDGLLNDVTRTDNIATYDLLVSDQAHPIDVAVRSVTFSGAPSPVPQNIQSYADEMGTATVDTTVALFKGDPVFGGATELSSQPVHLKGVVNGVGGSVSVTFPGIVVSNGETLTVCIDPDHLLPDISRADNCKSVTATKGNSDVAITTRDIRITPVGPNVGEPMTVSATIHELSGHAASGVARLWQGRPWFTGSHMLAQTRFHVAASGKTQVSWRLLRPKGDSNLWVALTDVSPRDAGEYEQLSSNNFALRNVYLKALIDTGRRFGGAAKLLWATGPVVGDIEETGHPAIVFGEHSDDGARITAVSLAPDGSYTELWSTIVGPSTYMPRTPLLADINGDGHPDVLETMSGAGGTGATELDVVLLDGHGRILWRHVLTMSSAGELDPKRLHVIADVNGDGTPDVVVFADTLVALDGATGAQIWSRPDAIPGLIEVPQGQVSVADVNGSGKPDFLLATGGQNSGGASLALYANNGQQLWAGTILNNGPTSDAFALLDLDLDGKPDILATAYQSWLKGFTAADGAQLWYQSFGATGFGVSAGDLRQDGLTYPVTATLGGPTIAAFRPSSGYLWLTQLTTRILSYNGQHSSLADLLGLGRPQVIADSGERTFTLFDGRNGRVLLSTGDYRVGNYRLPPVIADADGDGHGDILEGDGVAHIPGYDTNDFNRYPPAAVDVFSSVHWKRMPTVWNRPFYVKGEVDSHLHFLGNYQPWKTGNTWLDQYVGNTPATLLVDLTVGAKDIALSPMQPASGGTAQVQVTVHNVGGVAASNVDVEVWDGDPKAGGRIIGTGTAAGPLAVRGGSATVSVPWTAYPDGEHHIYAIVNPKHAIAESGYDNNEAHRSLLVAPGTNLSDLAVTGAGMSVSPAAPVAGATATISTVVKNVGVRSSGPFTVAWYDGVPKAGLAPLATAQAPDLGAGSTEIVTAPMVLGPGGHEVYVVADVDQVTPDANRSNNLAWMRVSASIPTLPELTVPAFTAAPTTVMEGRSTTLTATVENLGQAVVGPVLGFYLGDPKAGGQLIGDVRVPGLIGTGQTATATASMDTHGLTGTQTVFAVVDPDNVIAESREDDNTASMPVTVTSPPVTLAVATDLPTYGANATASLTATVTDVSGTAREVKVDLTVERPDGSVVAVPGSGLDAVVAANGSWPVTATWNTATTPAGSYVIHAVARDATGVLAEAKAAFQILPAGGLYARVTVDKTSYLPGQTALVHTLLENDSVNSPVGPFTSTVTISGGGVRWQATRQIPSLSPGADRQMVDAYLVSPDLAPGTYQVDLAVTDSAGAPVTSDATQLVVTPTTAATGLVASMTVTPSQPAPGATVDVAVTVTNDGNTDISGAPVILSIRDPQTLSVLATVTGTVTVARRMTSVVQLPWVVAGVTPPADLVATVEIGGRILADTVIHVIKQVDTTPPAVTVTGVSDGEVTSKDATPVITATDASPFTMAVSLDGLAYVSGTPITSEGDHILSIVATDIYGNQTVLNIAFSIDHTPPKVSLTGIAEGTVTNAASVTVTADATDLHLASALLKVDGSIADSVTKLAGQPYHHDLALKAEGDHVVYLQARDEAQLSSDVTRHFAIDRTPPTVSLTGIADGTVINAKSVTVHATASDKHFSGATLKVDGSVVSLGAAPGPFSDDVTETAEGDYTVDLSAVDAAGNTASAHLGYAIDRTPPTITITGIPRRYTNQDVTPEVKVTDAHLDPKSVVITLNGAPFTPGTLVHAEGDYLLAVKAADLAGNTSQRAVPFTIDRTPPAITITGVTEGELSYNVVKPVITVTDRNLDPSAVSVTLNGVPYVSGTPIGADGVYTLAVHAADLAGNTSFKAVHFEVFQVHVTLASGARVGNALILSPCGQCSCPAPPVLASALKDAGLPGTVVATEGQWKDGVRSGLYDVLILYRSQEGEDDLDDEVVELVRQGVGLVVVSGEHDCDDEPHLAEALGARTQGEVQGATTLTVVKSTIGGAATLSFAGEATAQKLSGATAVGTAGGAVVLSIHELGAGKVAYLTFDPEAAPSPDAMAALVGRVLAWIRPAKLIPRVPDEGVVLDHSVDNSGPGRSYTLTQSIPTGTVVIAAPKSSSLSPQIVWPLTLKQGETALRYSEMRLPDAAGTSAFDAELDVIHPVRGPLPMAHTITKVAVPKDLATLTQEAIDAVAALPKQCHDDDQDALEALKHLEASPATREEAAENLEKLVHAAESLRKLGAIGAAARDAVDRLIRAWEAQWSVLPPEKDDPGDGAAAACEAKSGEGHP